MRCIDSASPTRIALGRAAGTCICGNLRLVRSAQTWARGDAMKTRTLHAKVEAGGFSRRGKRGPMRGVASVS